MFKIVLVAALAALAVDARSFSRAPHPNGRIVGGVNVSIEDYSYHVAVQFRGTYGCGGSIIGLHKMILTAGHCASSRSRNILSVRYGTSLRDQGGSVLNVSEVFQHPQYNPLTHEYDISVLKLDGNVVFSPPQVSPIILVSPDVQEGGRSAWVTGWGQIYHGGPLAEQLQAVEVQEVDRDECRRVYGENRITERTICFVDDGKDACTADSGGPLVTGNRQIGVVSWGPHGCGNPNRSGVYANIHNRNISDHIAAIMREHDSA